MNYIFKQKQIPQELIQIAVFKFKPSLHQGQGSELPLSFRDICRRLQAMPGVASSYLGEQLERPGTWTWVIRWASPAAHDAFLASPSFTNWIVSFRSIVDTYIFWKANVRGSLSAALNAPCTEVFTTYGASDSWLEVRLKPFVASVDAAHLPGHHGSFYGQYDVLMHDSPHPPEGNTVSMMLGWDSKEVHLAEMADDTVTDKNIHHVQKERKSTDMYHVNLKRLEKIYPTPRPPRPLLPMSNARTVDS
ncbi:hypothetical protein E4U21_001310 [Claviceps maximensis]|nr:hypothetical protein E4U21_001310 [Claviceps maximensis]